MVKTKKILELITSSSNEANELLPPKKISEVDNNMITYTQYDGYEYTDYIRHYITNKTNQPVTHLNLGFVRYYKKDTNVTQIKTIIDSDLVNDLEDLGFTKVSFFDHYDDSIKVDHLFYNDGIFFLANEIEHMGKQKTSDGKIYTNQPIIEGLHLYYTAATPKQKVTKTYIDLLNKISDHSKDIDKNINDIYLSIIVKKHYGYQIEDRKIGDLHKFSDIDLHYGEGFEENYNKLIEIASRNKKGLVIFHGKPGTGKTYCIKDFIRKVENKKPVYITAEIFENITSPEFVQFLLNESDLLDREEDNLLFIVEDAEKLIMKRDDHSYNSGGVSNLLNATDGLLNGMINIQAVLTFNTDINNIDSALLRSERLIGEIEFGEMSQERTKKLVEKLDIKEVPKDFYSSKKVVADVYALLKEREIVSHKLEVKTKDFIL